MVPYCTGGMPRREARAVALSQQAVQSAKRALRQ